MRNQADYTNFDGKANKRIVQAPGGKSSFSLGWGDSANDYPTKQEQANGRDNKNGRQGNNIYGQNYGYNNNQGYESYNQPLSVIGGNYGKGASKNKNSYEEINSRQSINSRTGATSQNIIGGEHGYNNYNPINHQSMSYQNYPTSNQGLTRNQQGKRFYEQRQDPVSFYKPSSSTNYKNIQQDELDMALQQQKYKVQSSRSQRNQIPNNAYQQQSVQTKPCVKIHQQINNDIFGNNYDYWKQDGHNPGNNPTNNKKKQQPYLYERNNQNSAQNRGLHDNLPMGVGRDEKTSVKVHNPPGGKSNFTFG